jgi:hypothetical protein
MPPVTTGSFSNHLAPGIRQIVGTNLGGRAAYYSQFCNVETSTRNYEDYLAGTGLPIAQNKGEGVDITSYDPIEGGTQRLSHTVYAIGFEVSEEAWEDDLYAGRGSAIRDGSNGMADSLAERVEVECHAPLQQANWATYTVLPDSTAWIATSHNPVTGGLGAAQANRPSVDVDFSVTSFRAALTTFRKYTNDQGLRIPNYTWPTQLIIPPDTEWDAKEILQSTYRPDTVARVENVTKNEVSILVDPYITDTDQWLLRAPKHHLYMLWRWRPRMDNFDDRRARVAVFVGYERFVCRPVHWLGWYGSSGA